MANYSIGQQSVGSYTQAIYNGDWVGLPPQVNPALGATVSLTSTSVAGNSGIDIATFAWWVVGTNNTSVTQLYNSSTSTQPAGFVWRQQNNVYSNTFINQGYSFTVEAGKGISIVPQGSFACSVYNANGGSILNGDTVYIVTASTSSTVPAGTVVTSTSTPSITDVTAYYTTNYVVINNAPSNVTSSSIVYISNVQSFAG